MTTSDASQQPASPEEHPPYSHLDFICGRGGKANTHPGNQWLLKDIVEPLKPRYLDCPDRTGEKPAVARVAMYALHARTGRFMKKDQEGTHVELDEPSTIKLLEQKLRENKAPKREGGNDSRPAANHHVQYHPVVDPDVRAQWELAKPKCLEVLMALQTHQHGRVFNKPVDPVKLNMLNYHDVITRPMDLGTIQKKFENGCYRSLEEFKSDVHLTFNNAMSYYPKQHYVYKWAEEMKDKFAVDCENRIMQLAAQDDAGTSQEKLQIGSYRGKRQREIKTTKQQESKRTPKRQQRERQREIDSLPAANPDVQSNSSDPPNTKALDSGVDNLPCHLMKESLLDSFDLDLENGDEISWIDHTQVDGLGASCLSHKPSEERVTEPPPSTPDAELPPRSECNTRSHSSDGLPGKDSEEPRMLDRFISDLSQDDLSQETGEPVIGTTEPSTTHVVLPPHLCKMQLEALVKFQSDVHFDNPMSHNPKESPAYNMAKETKELAVDHKNRIMQVEAEKDAKGTNRSLERIQCDSPLEDNQLHNRPTTDVRAQWELAKTKCLETLEALESHQHGWVFFQPLDLKVLAEMGFGDYFDVIKRPMELGMIRMKLKDGLYSLLEQFEADVHLTFDNALLYNAKGSDLYNIAEAMKGEFTVDYQNRITQLEAKEDTTFTSRSSKKIRCNSPLEDNQLQIVSANRSVTSFESLASPSDQELVEHQREQQEDRARVERLLAEQRSFNADLIEEEVPSSPQHDIGLRSKPSLLSDESRDESEPGEDFMNKVVLANLSQ